MGVNRQKKSDTQKAKSRDIEATGCPISPSTLCFWHFSWTKLILNVKVGDVFKNPGNLLHDSHKNFENPCRNG